MMKNKKKTTTSKTMDKVAPISLQQLTSTPSVTRDKEINLQNPFESLYMDAEADSSFSGRPFPSLPGEHPLPDIPVIPNVKNLNETQKAVMMLRFAEQMGLKPGEGILPRSSTSPPPIASKAASATLDDEFADILATASLITAPTGARPATAAAAAAAVAAAAAAGKGATEAAMQPSGAASSSVANSALAVGSRVTRPATPAAAAAAAAAAATPAAAVAAAAAAAVSVTTSGLPKRPRGVSIDNGNRGRSGSQKRKNGDAPVAMGAKRQKQMSPSATGVQVVFLTGLKSNIIKNGISFRKEFSKAVPHIKLDKINITRSGSVVLSPSTPEDFSRLFKEDWSKHDALGSNILVSLPKGKTIQYKAVITDVDPDLDNDDLKAELEDRNSLKVTGITRLLNKETRTKIRKVIVCLENEETQRRVLRDGIYLGYQLHRCVEALDKQRDDTGNDVKQCFRCQVWNPDHSSAQCKSQRACLWCGDAHFHRECPHFQNKDRAKAKCVNCNEAHPAWSKTCKAFTAAAAAAPPRVSTARIISSASVSRDDLETEVKRAMSTLWATLAKVVATVVSRAVLDLDAEQKKPKVSKGELVRKTSANTVKAINECGLLPPNGSLEVAGVQQAVWNEVFSQTDTPHSSQAGSTPNISSTNVS